MGCVLAVPNERSTVGVLQRRGAQYTEAAALEETLRFCATLPVARPHNRMPNVIEFKGKSFMFNPSPPESSKALQGIISPELLTVRSVMPDKSGGERAVAHTSPSFGS
eukprot:6201465-Pleurochrysis_carterae.AAC.6